MDPRLRGDDTCARGGLRPNRPFCSHPRLWSRFPQGPFRATERATIPPGGGKAMQRTKPPFRADHVGSILRSAAIKDARAKHEKGKLSAAELKAVEDREIEKIIKKQEEVGLKLAPDGEYRRSWWHFDFFWGLTGVEKVVLDHGIQFHGVETRPESLRISGKVDFPADHPMLEHF